MDIVDYLTGSIVIAVIVGGLWLAAGRLRAWLTPVWSGAPAILVRVVLALALAVVTAELLGLVGLLDAPGLTIAAVLLAAGLRWLRPSRTAAEASPPPPAPSAGTVGLVLAVAAALLTAIHWMGPVLESLDVGIYRQDSVWYHLPQAARFAQTGSVTGLLFTDPLKLAVWYYPANSELLHSIGMVAFGNDLLSPLLNFGWMGVALLAAWCIGRPFGLAPATLLAGVVVVDSDMMLVQAGNAPSDIVGLACLLAAIAILVNGAAARTAGGGDAGRLEIDRGPLAVAALAAGLAIGTKVTLLVPVGVITIAVIWAQRGRGRRGAEMWLGGLLGAGGFWYLRNLVHSGNPLPWISFGPLPGPHQEAIYPRPAHSIAGYLADRHAWTHFFGPGLSDTLGPLWFVVLFAAAAGILLGLRRRRNPLIRVLALAAAATLVAHIFNPISAPGPEGRPTASPPTCATPFPGWRSGSSCCRSASRDRWPAACSSPPTPCWRRSRRSPRRNGSSPSRRRRWRSAAAPSSRRSGWPAARSSGVVAWRSPWRSPLSSPPATRSSASTSRTATGPTWRPASTTPGSGPPASGA